MYISIRLQCLGRADGRDRRFVWNALPRGLALFLGGFSLLNSFASLRGAGFDANLWWLDLHFLPKLFARLLLLTGGACLLGFALRPPHSAWRRWLTLACAGALGIAATVNTAQFYLLLACGTVRSGIPIALSLFVAAALGLIFLVTLRNRIASDSGLPRFRIWAVCLACLLVFPVLQMLCFGETDYRRPADVAVVLGARVYADGRPSDALADRVRTACQLYREGLAKKLVFSGGPGDGAIHETESMKRMALGLGVKPEDIVLDPAGLNTQATVLNTESLFGQLRASRILVVSHFYHLPRIKMTYQRTGWEVYTVPAKEPQVLRQLPYNMAREVAALWVYYARALAGLG
jgi:vancomycin permeability regulator SanA